MTLTDVPGRLILEFERGYIPLTDPTEQMAFCLWMAGRRKADDGLVLALADRVHKQSELLSRRAEK